MKLFSSIICEILIVQFILSPLQVAHAQIAPTQGSEFQGNSVAFLKSKIRTYQIKGWRVEDSNHQVINLPAVLNNILDGKNNPQSNFLKQSIFIYPSRQKQIGYYTEFRNIAFLNHHLTYSKVYRDEISNQELASNSFDLPLQRGELNQKTIDSIKRGELFMNLDLQLHLKKAYPGKILEAGVSNNQMIFLVLICFSAFLLADGKILKTRAGGSYMESTELRPFFYESTDINKKRLGGALTFLTLVGTLCALIYLFSSDKEKLSAGDQSSLNGSASQPNTPSASSGSGINIITGVSHDISKGTAVLEKYEYCGMGSPGYFPITSQKPLTCKPGLACTGRQWTEIEKEQFGWIYYCE